MTYTDLENIDSEITNLENIDLNKYTKPSQFKDRINVLQEQLPAILNDFKNAYILYNKDPQYDEYRQTYENIKSNLNKINADLFVLSNEIETSTNDINEQLFKLNDLIEEEKKINKELKIELGIVERKSNASTEMITNFEEIYDSQYLSNWGLFFSIIVGGVIIKNIYKS